MRLGTIVWVVWIGSAEGGYIWIRSSPQEVWRNRSALVDEVLDPILCDHVFMHSADAVNYEESTDSAYIRHQLEWLPTDDCYISYASSGRRTLRSGKDPNTPLTAKRRSSRYEALAELSKLAYRGLLRTVDGKSLPWILYADYDVIPLNKKKTISFLVSKLERGLTSHSNTTETRVCHKFNACERTALAPSDVGRVDRIAFIISPDLMCHKDWLLNSGMLLTRPSSFFRFLHEAQRKALTTEEYSSSLEQGTLALVLEDLFGFSRDFLHSLCELGEEEDWGPSMPNVEDGGNEIVLLRKFNIQKAIKHRVFGRIAKHWFPKGRVPDGEADVLAIVNPRWMNSWGCHNRLKHKIANWFYHCGDAFAHFYSCHQLGYYSKRFRQRVTATDECTDLLPFQTDDENIGPFDALEWREEYRKS